MRTDNDTHVHWNETTITLNLNKGCIFMDNNLIAEISRNFLKKIYEKCYYLYLHHLLNLHYINIFFIIIDAIIDTGKSSDMENSSGKKSGGEIPTGKSPGEEILAGKSPARKSPSGKIPFEGIGNMIFCYCLPTYRRGTHRNFFLLSLLILKLKSWSNVASRPSYGTKG